MEVGAIHTCGIRQNGSLWCWGGGYNGALGQGEEDRDNKAEPVQVGRSKGWLHVSAGGQYTCAVDSGHSLWCWGRNSVGNLGVGDSLNRYSPTLVERPSAWTSVSAGDASTCAVTTRGSLWCWGYNSQGQLGVGDTEIHDLPTHVGTATTWRTASNSYGLHTCGLKNADALYCWGYNSYGQLGLGDTTNRLVPRRV